MADSDDDFEVINYTSSSDSEWERINYSDEEFEEVKPSHETNIPQPDNVGTSTDASVQQGNKQPKKTARSSIGFRRKKETRVNVPLKRMKGIISPEDHVDELRISVEDISLLASHSIYTVGQLASCDVTKLPNMNSEKYINLQEQACQIATEYLTKQSSNGILWGHCYISEFAFVQGLKYGYFDSDSLYFVWTPMPAETHKNCVTIDRIMSKQTKDTILYDRYFRKVKINLSELCEYYNTTIMIKDGNQWCPIRLTEVEAWMTGTDIWDNFEPGTDLYQHIPHGKLDIAHKQIPLNCIEFEGPLPVLPRDAQEDDDDELSAYIPAGYDDVVGNTGAALKVPRMKTQITRTKNNLISPRGNKLIRAYW
jgi:hypothetical protein